MHCRTLPLLLLWLALIAASVCAQTVDVRRADAGRMSHDEWALQVVFTPDGHLISAGLDGRIRLWDVQAEKLLRELKGADTNSVLSLALAPDGRQLAAGESGGRVRLWDLPTGASVRELQADAQLVNAVAYSADGKYVAAGGAEGKVRIWATSGATQPVELNPQAGQIVSLAFTPDGQQLVVGTLARQGRQRSGEVGVWKWQTGTRVYRFAGAPGLRALAISPDGKLVAAAEQRSAAELFLLPTGGTGIEASMRVLGESDEPGTVGVWDLTTGQQVAAFAVELGAGALVFSPDGALLACAGEHGLMLQDVSGRTFLERGRYDTQTRVDAVAFSADGGRVVVAQERARLAEFKPGGLKKLTDPFFVAATGLAKEGTASGVQGTATSGSLTGGSTLAVLSLSTRNTPEDARLWTAYRQFFVQHQEAATRAALEQLAADFPRFAEVRRAQAVLFARDDLKKAEGLLQAAVQAEPNCAGCYRTLGDVQRKQQKWTEAAASYQRALALRPEFGLVSGALADTYSQQALALLNPDEPKTLDAARKLLEDAIRLRPADAHHYSNLSTVYYFGGNFDVSIQLLETAQQLRPDYARTYYNLGHAYRQKGLRDKALAAYQRYVLLGEPGEEARVERAKQIIEELKKAH